MVWGVIIIIIILLQLYYQKWVEKKKYEDQEYLENLAKIEVFLELIDTKDDYITWFERDKILHKYSTQAKFFKRKTNFYKKESNVARFNKIYHDFLNFVREYNEKYVASEKERLQKYFDNIEGKSLDEQQRNAVLTNEYSNLIVAGAGSGKTLTILAKVKYLIEKKMINSEEILILSFTQKTVEELNERLRKINPDIKASTFHKLGYGIVKRFSLQAPSVTNENVLRNLIKEYLSTGIFKHPKALNAYVQYVACYMNIPEEYDKYNSLGERIDTERGIDFKTLKSKCESLNIERTANLNTIQGEKVKSLEELTIANFLYLNGINYEYERQYPIDEFVYQPDFYLTDYDIYLEHFGIDKDNRAKWLSEFNERQYLEGMIKKRLIHKENQTKLLETYSHFNRDNILIEKLKEMLKEEGIEFSPRDPKEILVKVTDNEERFGSELNKLLETFINLSKSRRLTKESLIKLFSDQRSFFNPFMRDRHQMFLDFALPIFEKYDTLLKDRNEIDFNDMINQATDLLVSKNPNFPYKQIIIDEYQDISYSRFELIKKIRALSNARLTCVGDDWQSIYRFAGSDVSLFSNFKKYVGEYQLLLIENTYRNSQSLIDISSKFIKKNKKQIVKNPKSQKSEFHNPIRFINYSEQNLESTFLREVQYLVNKYRNKSILVLGRHSFDINVLIRSSSTNKIKYIQRTDRLKIQGYENLDIKFLTTHRSKGTEADNVILLNLKNDLFGFPNKMTDDPILSILLSDSDEYKFAEERRLFYVALTRTKNEVILMTPKDSSLFADEIIKENSFIWSSSGRILGQTNCPYCKTGKLLIRQNKSDNDKFLGCSNFPSCNQIFKNISILDSKLICPDCESGFMVKRKGKYGEFLGCTNYPKCKCTLELTSENKQSGKIGFI